MAKFWLYQLFTWLFYFLGDGCLAFMDEPNGESYVQNILNLKVFIKLKSR